MNRRLLLFFLITLVLFSCGEPPPRPLKETLVGQWNWVLSSGGIDGRIETPETENLTAAIRFHTDGKFQRFRNDTLVSSTMYSLSTGETPFASDPIDVIRFEDQSMEMAILYLKKDSLILGENCLDCFSHLYARAR